jgi:two-component system response regulator
MGAKDNLKLIEILLVEDNPGDIVLTKEAFKESKILVNLNIVEDGLEALDYLNQKEQYKEKPKPDLILLDLNLPRMNGFELLTKIKKNKSLRNIPVVVLTCSNATEDIIKIYALRANCFITKPVNLKQFNNVIKGISNFWFNIVQLPPAL